MVIDTSAILCILQDEPERHRFNQAIEEADACVISAATLVEVSIVVEARYGAEGRQLLDTFLAKAGVEIVAFDAKQAEAARRAFSHFGKGRHPANLNLGDCFTFALTEVRMDRLLFKGEDFAAAGIEAM